ncbi:MAG: hypothetical protein QG656_2497 [Candidatus Hydrogenedentes bacterium]|nr:hypothetical protein [Candidatus Hydrogenedentota bacterium]
MEAQIWLLLNIVRCRAPGLTAEVSLAFTFQPPIRGGCSFSQPLIVPSYVFRFLLQIMYVFL